MSKTKELVCAVETLEELLKREQQKDYIDWCWYWDNFNKLQKLKGELLTELARTGETIIYNGKKYKLIVSI